MAAAHSGPERARTDQPAAPSGSRGRWQFWIDRGGTFTDIVALRPDGTLVSHKLLSENPEHYDDAAVAGIAELLGSVRPAGTPNSGAIVDPDLVGQVRMGTTVATNALLTRRGARTAVVLTKGFADALRIGYQSRPRIFDRHIVLPEMLYERVLVADERILADGTVDRELQVDDLREQLRQARADGVEAVAVACMHSHLYPGHERAIGELAREVGFPQVSLSSEASPLMKLVPRGDTAVADAYLTPVLRRYIDSVVSRLPGVDLMFMQSNGGLAEAGHFRGKDAILSGPAGGIVGMARMAELAGHDRVIGFDMGGTSTDVSHHAGQYERVFDTVVAGVRLRAPMLDIHTVAAGGGSILHFDGTRYRVGPDSAGADPGPACYRRGGPLTVTDANVMLGRIQPGHFPHVFGPGGDEPLDVDTVRAEFAGFADEIREQTGDDRTPEEVAEGFIAIAVANMANAVKQISVRKGHDVTGYALTTFGGAGGQHACAVADALGIRTVLVPPMAGVLSALGMGLADTTVLREQSVVRPLDESSLPDVERLADELVDRARAELAEQSRGSETVEVVRGAQLRYDGTDTPIAVELDTIEEMTAAFEAVHRRSYSFLMDRPLVVEAVTVEATALTGHRDLRLGQASGEPQPAGGADSREGRAEVFIAGRRRMVPLLRRASLREGESVDGPALIVEPDSTTFVGDRWRARAGDAGHLVLERAGDIEDVSVSAAVDPVMLEIFNNLFTAIAEQMGAALESTAQSVNIKERMDFSCALFDPDGNLIANAPHIPVHLGSMGASVKEVITRRRGEMRPGDVYAVNDPYHGGTHLPDITVITPVFEESAPSRESRDPEVLFYVASRGHHAEIGGLTPGSMPAESRHIDEEGVLFDNWLLVSDGRLRERETLELLAGARYPSRSPETNIADLRAQIAANAKGEWEVRKMIDHFGRDVVQAYMRHVQDNAAEAVRRVIDALPGGEYRYETDAGATIAVRVQVDRENRSAIIDFTGTSAQLDSNFNAPSAVTTAAVLYVFRTLVADDIPLNDGCLRPLRIVVEPGSMLAPRYPAAVVAGNVETSQSVTGALYAALGVQAEGSGTMNNVTFGNARHQYYETLGSGSGAGDGFDGASVVQTHMTNSRLTDPEVLEWRLPVVLEDFAIRRGSGGAGRWRGGEGALRRLRFTEAMTVSTLSGHRRVPPYGMAGGEPGGLGSNAVERAGGEVEQLPACASVDVAAGDVLIVQTPGGGGYGPPAERTPSEPSDAGAASS